MNLIVICIYNRIDNIKQWLHCWKQCNTPGQLVIIHNHYNEPGLRESIESLIPDGVTYVPRETNGYDIGAFQDVCCNRLKGFPTDWDNLLWCTDDTLPMVKDFATPFWTGLKRNKCVAMEVSPYVNKHVRTTGFAVTRAAAEALVFPCDPVTTKEDCYHFEHRSKNTMYDQIGGVMVAPQVSSPLFDFGYHRRLKQREAEHWKVFGNSKPVVIAPPPEPITDTITIICPIYDAYPQIVSSLLCQTYPHWKLWLIHDGPNELSLPDDPRITYIKVPRKENDYGHSLRREYLQKVETPYVLITNGDNYYMPTFLDKAVKAMVNGTVATYCAQIIHNYTDYKVMNCSLQRGYIDCGQVLLRTEQAKAVGWNSTEHSADWFFFEAIAKRYGARNFVPFKGALFVHN